jgi:S1-C subfamily serine protease
MLAANPSRYSLLAVVGAGFFVSAPIATWLVADAMTSPRIDMPELVALDIAVDSEGVTPPGTSPVAPQPLPLSLPLPLDVAFAEAQAQGLHRLAQDARIVPQFQNGRAIGFKLFSIRPGSDFQRAGLLNGDVLTRINGIELTSPTRALEAYERANDGLIVVDFLRRGERGTLTHHLPAPPSSSSSPAATLQQP